MNNAKYRRMLNKVPEVTLYFWIIKVLCTTVGETGADLLNQRLHLGLVHTTYIMGALLAIALLFQFRANRYIAGLYWIVVVFLSVFGTLITDNLTDRMGVPLETSTLIFGAALALTFFAWYRVERTLSIHSIHTTRREAFYWLAILFTFALGTAAGDLMAERFHLGYGPSVLIFAAGIALITAAYFWAHLDAVVAFWMAYILTRPLGASLGDYLSQARADGGLGLGTVTTSGIFLAAILVTVIYLSITGRDVQENDVDSGRQPVLAPHPRLGLSK